VTSKPTCELSELRPAMIVNVAVYVDSKADE
jgi:hypothetical protein